MTRKFSTPPGPAAVAATVAAAISLAVPLAVTGAAHAQTTTPPSLEPAPPPAECLRHLSIGDRTVYEGTDLTVNPGHTPAAVAVTTSGCARAGTVHWYTFNGTAEAPYDYVSASGTFTYAAGSTSTRWIITSIVRDLSPGDDEYFWIRLVSDTGAINVVDRYGKVTILNDDEVCSAPIDLPPGWPSWHCME